MQSIRAPGKKCLYNVVCYRIPRDSVETERSNSRQDYPCFLIEEIKPTIEIFLLIHILYYIIHSNPNWAPSSLASALRCGYKPASQAEFTRLSTRTNDEAATLEGPLSDVPINQSNVAQSSSSKATQESTRAQMITTQKCRYNRAKLSKLNGISKFVRFIHREALIFHER